MMKVKKLRATPDEILTALCRLRAMSREEHNGHIRHLDAAIGLGFIKHRDDWHVSVKDKLTQTFRIANFIGIGDAAFWSRFRDHAGRLGGGYHTDSYLVVEEIKSPEAQKDRGRWARPHKAARHEAQAEDGR